MWHFLPWHRNFHIQSSTFYHDTETSTNKVTLLPWHRNIHKQVGMLYHDTETLKNKVTLVPWHRNIAIVERFSMTDTSTNNVALFTMTQKHSPTRWSFYHNTETSKTKWHFYHATKASPNKTTLLPGHKHRQTIPFYPDTNIPRQCPFTMTCTSLAIAF